MKKLAETSMLGESSYLRPSRQPRHSANAYDDFPSSTLCRHPGYASSSYRSDVPGGSTAARIPPEAAYLRNGSSQAYEGSRTHLPPISSMPAGHADEPPKKRRPGYPYDHYSDSSNPRQVRLA